MYDGGASMLASINSLQLENLTLASQQANITSFMYLASLLTSYLLVTTLVHLIVLPSYNLLIISSKTFVLFIGFVWGMRTVMAPTSSHQTLLSHKFFFVISTSTSFLLITFTLPSVMDIIWPISQSYFHVPHLCSLK